MSRKILESIAAGIKHSKIRESAEWTITQAPDYFWHIPSSLSGKYHPQDELGAGGLVIHTIKVCRMIPLLLPAYTISPEPETLDLFLMAGIIHDFFRCGVPPGVNLDEDGRLKTDTEHPRYPGMYWWSDWERLGLSHGHAGMIDTLVRGHYGPWSQSSGMFDPTNKFQHCFFMADFVVSRRQIQIGGAA